MEISVHMDWKTPGRRSCWALPAMQVLASLSSSVSVRRLWEGTAAARAQGREGWRGTALAHPAVAGRCWAESKAAGGREESHPSRMRPGHCKCNRPVSRGRVCYLWNL